MARPIKDGLDYFPMDVDFFNDEKIEAIMGQYGIKGEIITIKLLCAIYRNGYFILWSDMLKMKLLKNLPGVSKELLEDVVVSLVKWNFFDKGLFDSDNVLTSNGIQNRFIEATKRRKTSTKLIYACNNSPKNEIDVVNDNINTQSNVVNDNINTQSKVKESKELLFNSENQNFSILTEEPKYSINQAIAFTFKPYIAQTPEFKKMHTEKEYVDYQWFINLLKDNIEIFANIFTSEYQVTFPQYKKLISKFSIEEIPAGLQLLCGKPVLKEHRMCHRIVEYIGYVVERANRSNLSQKNGNTAILKSNANTAKYTNPISEEKTYGKKLSKPSQEQPKE